MDRFKVGDFVFVKNGQFAKTGTVKGREPRGSQQRYLVFFDSESNDTEFLPQGLYYEDELELCQPPRTI